MEVGLKDILVELIRICKCIELGNDGMCFIFERVYLIGIWKI